MKIAPVPEFAMMYSVESVEPENDISLEGWTSCNVSTFIGSPFEISYFLHLLLRVQAFTNATEQLYASSFFKAKGQEQNGFLQALAPYLDGRSVQFENMACCSFNVHVALF